MALAYADLTCSLRQLSAHVIEEPLDRVPYFSNLVIADLVWISVAYSAHNVTNKSGIIARFEQNVQLWMASETATQYGTQMLFSSSATFQALSNSQ